MKLVKIFDNKNLLKEGGALVLLEILNKFWF